MNQASLSKVLNGTREERAFLCEQDFSLFFVYYFKAYIKYRFAPFHFEMFKDLEDLMTDKYREVAWLMFRESAKTSLAKAFLLWLITYKKRLYLNVDSFDKENAERVLFDVVVEMQTNHTFKSDFGELYNAKRDPNEATQKRINNFVTNNGVRVEAHSTQESVRGRLHGHQRPDFLLLDDFETNRTKDSQAYTKQVVDHISEFKGGLDATAKVLYLGNYITEFGSIQSLIDRAKTDDRLFIRNVPVELNGAPTWSEKYVMTNAEAEGSGKVSLEDKKKQLGSLVYSAEMLNQPVDEASAKFFRKWFKTKPVAYVDTIRTRKFILIDTALSKHAESDNTGIAKIWVDEQNNWYVAARRYRINPKTLIDLMFQFHDAGFEKIGIEKTAYSEAIEPFIQEEMRVRGKYPHVIQLSHGGVNKEVRIEGLVPRYEVGQMFHIEGECDDLEEELLKFPRSPHDDVVDAVRYGLKLCEKPFPQSEMVEQEPEMMYNEIGI
jgi:phage terminase large subunit-like protein